MVSDRQLGAGNISTDFTLVDKVWRDNPQRNNFAPRIGFAYSLDSKTAIRSGYGISYIHFNRSGGGNILAINGPQVVNAVVNQRPGDAAFRTLEQGYPAGLTDPDKFNPLASNISYMPRDLRTGYVQNWFLSVQREIFKDTLFDIAYVGNRSNKLILFADYNQARPNNPGEIAALQLRRPIREFAGITLTCPCGWANYNALQLKFERRFNAGLSFLNSFTWAKALDNVGQALEDQGNGNRSSPQNYFNLRAEKGPSGFDQRLNNTTSVVWEAPFGKGRKFGSTWGGAADAVLGGWQISAINTMASGEPLNLLYSPVANFQVSDIGSDWRGAISYRPNVSGNPRDFGGTQVDRTRFLNPAAVSVPTDPSQPFGNIGRNAVYGPGFFQIDTNVQKTFRVTERFSVQFRSEFFNLLNKTNMRSDSANRVNRSNALFGLFGATYPARQAQFALKLIF